MVPGYKGYNKAINPTFSESGIRDLPRDGANTAFVRPTTGNAVVCTPVSVLHHSLQPSPISFSPPDCASAEFTLEYYSNINKSQPLDQEPEPSCFRIEAKSHTLSVSPDPAHQFPESVSPSPGIFISRQSRKAVPPKRFSPRRALKRLLGFFRACSSAAAHPSSAPYLSDLLHDYKLVIEKGSMISYIIRIDYHYHRLKRSKHAFPNIHLLIYIHSSASFLFTHIFFFFAITGKMDHLKFLRNPARGMGLFDHAPVIRCNLIFTWIHDSRPSTPFNPPGLRSFQAPTWSDFAWLHPRTIPPNAHASMTYSNRHQPFCQA